MNLNKDFIDSLIRPEVLAMNAYKVADASGFIKLDAMENPYHWPEDLTQQWLETIRSCPINRYPDPEATELAATLKQTTQVPDTAKLFIANDSNQKIQIM